GGEGGGGAAASPGAGVPAGGAGRHQLLDPIGRGGMGAVLRGHDPDLGRELAVKVLLPQHRGNRGLVRRFLEEAQICGQLQHPGVPPVHELGRLDDGRPYFTMKLVRGRTLAALLAERPDPAAERPHFLAIFEQVCQTVAYAHEKGVLHRDLKPANVMVGRFGEVQVMAWGLAKVLTPAGRGREAPETAPAEEPSVVQTAGSGPAGPQTQAGEVLGTFAYMPPEQARGEAGWLDERCDVFSLGAVLCAVLTGRPPYTGPDREAVW